MAAALAFAAASPVPSQPQPPASIASPSVTPKPPRTGATVLPLAREWLRRVQMGDIDRTQLDATMNTAMTSHMVAAMRSAYRRAGSPVSFTFVGSYELPGANVAYDYRVRFARRKLFERIVFDRNGLISGLRFRPF